jgi:hypothetical protein
MFRAALDLLEVRAMAFRQKKKKIRAMAPSLAVNSLWAASSFRVLPHHAHNL